MLSITRPPVSSPRPGRHLFVKCSLSDLSIGLILLACSLLVLCSCLILLVKVLNSLLKGRVASAINKVVNAGACWSRYPQKVKCKFCDSEVTNPSPVCSFMSCRFPLSCHLAGWLRGSARGGWHDLSGSEQFRLHLCDHSSHRCTDTHRHECPPLLEISNGVFSFSKSMKLSVWHKPPKCQYAYKYDLWISGIGVISIERAYPLTLGSNLGTTTTATLAALASPGDKLAAATQVQRNMSAILWLENQNCITHFHFTSFRLHYVIFSLICSASCCGTPYRQAACPYVWPAPLASIQPGEQRCLILLLHQS